MKAGELFGHWREVRRGLFRALDKLSDEQLGFVPREGLWSLGTVACHLADAEDGWLHFLVRQELPEWPSYSAADYPTVAAVKALLIRAHDRTEANLTTLDGDELDRVFTTPWGESVSLGWIIWHVLEHEIHHRGEIFLMLGLMGMEGPDS